jgi:hypothetical protein
MSFGRPVEPPEVGAFHAGLTTSGNGSVPARNVVSYPCGRHQRDRSVPDSTPTTTAESANSTNASSSRRGNRLLNGCGIAPSIQAATVATNHSTEFGNATLTIDPTPTPPSARSRASASARCCNSARVTVSAPQVIAARSGSASAKSANRRANEMAGMSKHHRGSRARPFATTHRFRK